VLNTSNLSDREPKRQDLYDNDPESTLLVAINVLRICGFPPKKERNQQHHHHNNQFLKVFPVFKKKCLITLLLH
jgi:hypothetical protein